jgi:hypothetical protein
MPSNKPSRERTLVRRKWHNPRYCPLESHVPSGLWRVGGWPTLSFWNLDLPSKVVPHPSLFSSEGWVIKTGGAGSGRGGGGRRG